MTQCNQYRNQWPAVTQERLDEAQALFADGASQAEVVRTTGLSRETLLKYLPKTTWSFSEAGKHSVAVRNAKKQGFL